ESGCARAGASAEADGVLVLVADPDHQLGVRDRWCRGVAKPEVIDRVSAGAHGERPVARYRLERADRLGLLVGSIELDAVVTGAPAADDRGEGARSIVRGLEAA